MHKNPLLAYFVKYDYKLHCPCMKLNLYNRILECKVNSCYIFIFQCTFLNTSNPYSYWIMRLDISSFNLCGLPAQKMSFYDKLERSIVLCCDSFQGNPENVNGKRDTDIELWPQGFFLLPLPSLGKFRLSWCHCVDSLPLSQ